MTLNKISKKWNDSCKTYEVINNTLKYCKCVS